MPVRRLESICDKMDSLSQRVGAIVCWLFIPLTFLVLVEVICRYMFNHPTIWVWDVNIQLMGTLVILGGCYALSHHAHIGVDLLTKSLPPEKRVFIELITHLFFLFFMAIILWELAQAAWVSIQTRERYMSYLMPPLYPFKTIVAVGVGLLYLQGVANTIRLFMALVSRIGKGSKT